MPLFVFLSHLGSRKTNPAPRAVNAIAKKLTSEIETERHAAVLALWGFETRSEQVQDDLVSALSSDIFTARIAAKILARDELVVGPSIPAFRALLGRSKERLENRADTLSYLMEGSDAKLRAGACRFLAHGLVEHDFSAKLRQRLEDIEAPVRAAAASTIYHHATGTWSGYTIQRSSTRASSEPSWLL